MSSRLMVAKKNSATALSQHSPFWVADVGDVPDVAAVDLWAYLATVPTRPAARWWAGHRPTSAGSDALLDQVLGRLGLGGGDPGAPAHPQGRSSGSQRSY